MNLKNQQVILKKDEVILKKDQVILKKDQVILKQDKDKYRSSVQYIFDNGYLPLRLDKGYAKDSEPSSKHFDNGFIITEVNLNLIANIEKYRTLSLNFNPALNSKINIEDKAIDYVSESDVQGFVKDVMYDVINVAGISGRINIYNEITLTRLRPDIWIVMKDKRSPLCVVEVKKPPSSERIPLKSNRNVISQVVLML